MLMTVRQSKVSCVGKGLVNNLSVKLKLKFNIRKLESMKIESQKVKKLTNFSEPSGNLTRISYYRLLSNFRAPSTLDSAFSAEKRKEEEGAP